MVRALTDAVRRLYARRLRARLARATVPRHLAIVMDGNRRWARQAGFDDPRIGHRYGAEHLDEVLGWCAEIGIGRVTVFVASADNLAKRDPGEVDHLESGSRAGVRRRRRDPDPEGR